MDTNPQLTKQVEIDQSATLGSARHPEQLNDPVRHVHQANSSWARFKISGRLEDLDSAIAFQQAALDSCSLEVTDRARTLHNIAFLLRTRHERWGESDDLERAILMNRSALGLRPEGHPNRATSLNNLANTLFSRFRQERRKEDLDECITLHRAALELRPEGHPERCISLNNIASSLLLRFEQDRCMEDLEDGISLYRAVLELLPDSHPKRSSSLSNTGNSLRTRFEVSGRLEDLDESITLHRAVLELRLKGHPDRPFSLDSIASSLLLRFRQRGRMEDLEESITLLRAALELMPEGHPKRFSPFNNLANSLLTRFQQSGKMEDLEESITLYHIALGLLPKSHSDRPSLLNNLASSFKTRFARAGRLEDLKESITLYHATLELLPKGHPDRPMSLNNLASSLLTQFEQEGRAEDLEESIALHRVALELRSENHPLRTSSLNNLASSVLMRFEQERRIEDLEECISLHREVLELLPEGHPNRCTSLNNIAISLWTHFKYRGRIEDLEESIALHRAALELRPEGHPDRSSSLHGIAIALLTRFKHGGLTEDLKESIILHRDALNLLPDGHPSRSLLLSNTASSLLPRFEKLGHAEDLDESISLYRAALDLQPEGHPYRSSTLHDYASCLGTRFEQRGQTEDLEETIHSLRLSTNHSFSGFSSRIQAAWKWVIFARRNDRQTLPEAHRRAMSLVQRALTFRDTWSAQHKFLSDDSLYRSLALDAASDAIGAGDYPQAIELLEKGRALLWSKLRGFRSPLEELSRTNATLAENFSACSRRLEALIASSDSSLKSMRTGGDGSRKPDASQQRQLFDEKLSQMRRLYEEQEALVGQIRRETGFENFLQVAPFEVIRQAASEGPVTVLNYSKYRCDALIVTSLIKNPCVCVPLDEAFYDDAAKLHDEFLRVRQKFKVFSTEYDEILQRVMKFLWDGVASRVVEKLKELGVKEGSRIWWCPTSLLTAFPFHASGPYEDASGKMKYLLDDYISSYTPTLTSLVNARFGVAIGSEKMLFVGDTQLPSAKKERNAIMRIRRFRQLIGNDATPEAVLKMLRRVRWVHFVCHGKLDEEPFKSSLMLPGGRLTLLDIVRANLPNAEFAFLSACHTAEQGQRYALDEALHLAAAMQFCGFRSVVGTMWQLLDRDGPFLAGAVYAHLMRDLEDGEARFKRGAAAVREAALRLREFGEPDPGSGRLMTERWVNLVHIGV